jgi:hypothetical protein
MRRTAVVATATVAVAGAGCWASHRRGRTYDLREVEQVAVFRSPRAAAQRVDFDKKLEPAPVIPSLRKANVVVYVQDPAELPHVRAALAELG